MLHAIVILIGMSFDIGGIGGLLSGLFSKSLKRALGWSCFWGIINCLIFWQLVQYGNANILTIIPLFLAIFWGAIGWLTLGKRRRQVVEVEND